MRLLLGLLSVLALMLAPLATPAMAATASSEAHCAEMGRQDHHPDKSPMMSDGKCCVAVPAAALPPSAGDPADAPAIASAATAGVAARLASIDVDEDDPPPRS